MRTGPFVSLPTVFLVPGTQQALREVWMETPGLTDLREAVQKL